MKDLILNYLNDELLVISDVVYSGAFFTPISPFPTPISSTLQTSQSGAR